MGVVKSIDHKSFPEQSECVGKSVDVCFKYNTGTTLKGVIVRDDIEEPWRTIIRLEDGRLVLAIECQYSPPIMKMEEGDDG